MAFTCSWVLRCVANVDSHASRIQESRVSGAVIWLGRAPSWCVDSVSYQDRPVKSACSRFSGWRRTMPSSSKLQEDHIALLTFYNYAFSEYHWLCTRNSRFFSSNRSVFRRLANCGVYPPHQSPRHPLCLSLPVDVG